MFNEITITDPKAVFTRQVENKILSGELKLGERLPTEREMAQELNVPRSVVHAGIEILEREGFVRVVPRKGIFVEDYMYCGNLDTFAAITSFSGGALDQRNFESIIQFRLLCEPYAASLAAQNRTGTDLEAMEKLCERLESTTDLDDACDARNLFNRAVFRASGNTIFPLLYNGFEVVEDTFSHMIFSSMGIDQAKIGDRELLEAIRDGDAERARALKLRTDKTIISVLRDNYFK